MSVSDPVVLFERATARAASGDVRGCPCLSWTDPTPCADWNVQQLIDHMVGGTDYLLAALAGETPPQRSGRTVEDYDAGLEQLRRGLRAPGGLERMCMSPLGFEWPVAHAVAGTFMDALIHTWDLATATGQDASLDPELVDACIAMFLPDMPERGRASGLVGPAVDRARRCVGTGSAAGGDGTPAVTPDVSDEAIRAIAHPAGERCCGWCGTRNDRPPSWPTRPGCRSRRPASTSSCCATPGW